MDLYKTYQTAFSSVIIFNQLLLNSAKLNKIETNY